MKKIITGRVFAILLALIFALSASFSLVSCLNENDDGIKESEPPVSTSAETPEETAAETPEDKRITITLEVVGPDGTSKEFVIKTDPENNLRKALEAESLIAGDEGPYGLYIKVVDGITADYDVDRSWWGLYKDGEMLMTGVDTTPIADGDHFELVYSK